MIQKIIKGPRDLVNKLNGWYSALVQLINMTGDGYIKIDKSSAGYRINLDIDRVNARMPKGQGGEGSGIRLCYLAVDPTDDFPLCHFDTVDSTKIDNVKFLIAAGETLSSAIPRMKKGDPVLVTSVQSEWYAIPPWNDGEACVA